MLIAKLIRDFFTRPHDEPEHDEAVEHDTVMVLVDGKLKEVTPDDLEVRQ